MMKDKKKMPKTITRKIPEKPVQKIQGKLTKNISEKPDKRPKGYDGISTEKNPEPYTHTRIGTKINLAKDMGDLFRKIVYFNMGFIAILTCLQGFGPHIGFALDDVSFAVSLVISLTPTGIGSLILKLLNK